MNKLVELGVKSLVKLGTTVIEKPTIIYLSKGASRSAVAAVYGGTILGVTAIIAGTVLINKIIDEKEIKIGNFEVR
ncbi:MAG: hypothetical protein ACRDAT_07050 [Cetobacterium sp.]